MSVCRARAANKGPASVLVSGTPALQSHVIVLRVSPVVPGSRAEGGTYLLPQVGRPTRTETTVPGDKPYPLFFPVLHGMFVPRISDPHRSITKGREAAVSHGSRLVPWCGQKLLRALGGE